MWSVVSSSRSCRLWQWLGHRREVENCTGLFLVTVVQALWGHKHLPEWICAMLQFQLPYRLRYKLLNKLGFATNRMQLLGLSCEYPDTTAPQFLFTNFKYKNQVNTKTLEILISELTIYTWYNHAQFSLIFLTNLQRRLKTRKKKAIKLLYILSSTLSNS